MDEKNLITEGQIAIRDTVLSLLAKKQLKKSNLRSVLLLKKYSKEEIGYAIDCMISESTIKHDEFSNQLFLSDTGSKLLSNGGYKQQNHDILMQRIRTSYDLILESDARKKNEEMIVTTTILNAAELKNIKFQKYFVIVNCVILLLNVILTYLNLSNG
jgi:hypothetical protein